MLETGYLRLTTNPRGWRIFTARVADERFQQLAASIYERDQHRCQFCGFQAKDHQHVVNLDGNYSNNDQANLATACSFCAQCGFLESINNSNYGGGILIHLPDMSQEQLNGLCHVIFCSIFHNLKQQSKGQNIYRDLRMRAQIVEKYLGEDMSKTEVFGVALAEMSVKQRKQIEPSLTAIRLLPSMSDFEHEMATWSASSLQALRDIADLNDYELSINS